jgi:hypothetical protein
MAAGVVTTRVEIAAVELSVCNACHHTATRSRDPWDNQYRCAEGCRCTMQGCCVGRTTQET